jgi:hypothetical protein
MLLAFVYVLRLFLGEFLQLRVCRMSGQNKVYKLEVS